MSRKSRSEAEQRQELGGYTEAEFDREFVRSHRSDWVSIATRVATLLVVYGLLARAIRAHDPPPWLLALPFVVEFLLIFWVGWFLSTFVVSCKAFAKSAGGIVRIVVSSLIFGGAMWAAILFNPGGTGRPESASVAWHEAVAWIVRADLHWALLAMAAALLGSTFQEVTRWKKEGGVFVWASIMTAGFRLGVAFLVAFFGAFVLVFAGDWISPWFEAGVFGVGRPLTWALYFFILLVEVLTLVVAIAMHRDAMKPKDEKTTAPQKSKRRLT
ncbi:MAG: hypothetical protein IPO95_07085 [Rhodanobacteraceae bacterium]|nr:hypothetical protein [Rhodanobacteraceae bacterium]MBL0040711.1 hypothetical protein [Xanthomonadales bacterium]